MSDPRIPLPSLSRVDRLWLTEAVRLREEHAGPLDDEEANRQARAGGGDLSTLIERRALWLARRDGLLEALRHWRQGARLGAIALAVLAIFTGAGLAFAALGDGQRPVNVFWALGSLLGLNLLTLLGWLLGLALAGDSGGALGRLWLWLSEKFARDARAAQLAPALPVLLQRQRLGRWLLGLGVHGLWLLAMTCALLMLLALLATRRYGFVWETTILGESAFVGLTQALGALPALLGFGVPDGEQIRASGTLAGDLESARRQWAGWLVGVVLVYGLLPRLLLAALCLWRWRRGRAALAIDLEQPSYRLLRERLQPPSERLGIRDAAPAQLHAPSAGAQLEAGAGAVLVAIELDGSRPWPPPLPKGVADAGVLDDREGRRRLLDQLTRFPPARLAIACDPRRSPDRGTLALLGELSRCAAATRVWLLQAPAGEALDSARLDAWHQALDALGLAHSSAAPLNWLENGHD
ncbi:DUF2868 domain-containing protein [Pseudomonas phenolilytica]|uniref:DUF2868 domain-containing protein n=1 Tax=Pseudomonas phenolilytica TaxID=2746321 RepID=UPI001F3ACDF4|nr:DUF2868 domain-containing protein [Pseudomonas phenolilytica]UIP85700.1 DUF2868 domain-containing protein [Pseudomonas phenolilytica]